MHKFEETGYIKVSEMIVLAWFEPYWIFSEKYGGILLRKVVKNILEPLVY